MAGIDQQGHRLRQAYSLTINPPLPLAIVLPTCGSTLPSGTVGVTYAQNFFQLAGTPTTAGTFVFTVKVPDGAAAIRPSSNSASSSRNDHRRPGRHLAPATIRTTGRANENLMGRFQISRTQLERSFPNIGGTAAD